MLGKWRKKLDEIRLQAEETLNQQELKEFEARIAVLQRELMDKQNMAQSRVCPISAIGAEGFLNSAPLLQPPVGICFT